MIDTSGTATQRYFWLPVPDESSAYGLARHAFPGTRLAAGLADAGYCGETFALAIPSEVDWIHAPTCQACNSKLKEMKGWPT
ncbi:zinc finger protein [Saccharopolyspora sp. 5N708]|uniref:zinc finger protein n=1 Tax=Saccharopolyspora sp. 5N708 TaxID=3457424 RepID=UPI003FD1827E